MAECPSDDALLAFAAGRASGAAVDVLIAHLDGCVTCQAALDAAVQEDAVPAEGGPGPEAAELASGARVGRYTILHRIGAGGMGVVYAAYDPELDRRVALKLLRPGAGGPSSSDEARARLTREARAMAKLTHPNVAAVHDAGTHGGDVFVAMELVDGPDLRHWLRERKRDWAETLRILIAAGRGLAAAHGAGLVHRDVKPDNILVGRDGQVRVTDFGLARSALAPEPAPPGAAPGPEPEEAPPPSDPALTRHGALVGTPAYLAPEQLRGLPAGPLSDQFSFCVTAFEALHGERPFHGIDRERMARGLAAAPPDPPSDSPVPARIRSAVRRGLELDPARRYPSMDALLEDLSGRRARTRRQVAAAAVVLVITGAAGFAASAAMDRLSACRKVPGELAGVWGDPERQALQAAFARSDAPFAPGTWEVVRRSLDGYAAAWVELGASACEAGRRDPSRDLPLLQRVCLEHRRTELRALVEVLSGAGADPKLVAKSVEAASALTPISRCADAAALRAPVAPPRDAATREKVEALRERLAKLKALYDAGRYPAALPGAQAAVAEARALGHPPALAEALIRLGKIQLLSGAAKDAVPGYEEAELAAEEARDERNAAEAAVDLVQAHYLLQRVPQGQAWQRRAEAYVRRLGRDDDLQAALLFSSASLAREAGHLAEAVDLYGQAAAARERQFGPDHPLVGRALYGQAIALEYLGKLDRAMEIAGRVLAIQQKALGPQHPLALSAGYLQGLLLSDLGKSAEAVAVLRPVLEAQSAQLGADSPQAGDTAWALALALGGVREYAEAHRGYAVARAAAAKEKGEASFKVAQLWGDESDLLVGEKRYPEALAQAQRSLDLFDQAKLPEGDDRRVFPLQVQGQALLGLKRFREAAERYRRARAIREKALGKDSPFLVGPLRGLAESYLGTEEWNQAVPVLEECLRLLDAKPGPDPGNAGGVRFQLAQALWSGGGDRARALAVAGQAEQELAGLPDRAELRDQLSRWLKGKR